MSDPLETTRFYTVSEIALLARVSKMTVYRECHDGRLESVRIGRSFRIPEASVRRWLGGPLSDEESS